MTYDQFDTQMKRLMDCYGVKNYPAIRIEGYWKMSCEGDVFALSRAIDRHISDSLQPALGKFFEDFMSQSRKSNYTRSGLDNENTCRNCLGSGMVLAEERSTKHQYSFLCSFCNTAQAMNLTGVTKDDKRRMATWSGNLSHRYNLCIPPGAE